MIERRPWGYFQKYIDLKLFWIKKLVVNPHEKLSMQKHQHRVEVWFFPDGFKFIGRNQLHRLENDSNKLLVVWEIALGFCDENDVIRVEDKYNRR